MALIPPFYFDCVVAIGYLDEAKADTRWVASGFLYGHRLERRGDRVTYAVYLVTNRHVLAGRPQIVLRFNPSGPQPAQEYVLGLLGPNDKPLWCAPGQSDVDVAVVPIEYKALRRHAMQVSFFASDCHVAMRAQLRRMGVSEGDFAYVLGFPLGMVGERRSAVIARSGSLARIQEALTGHHHQFLLDAFVFPGNSGGPVVLKPERLAVQGTLASDRAWLIGVVSSYVAYEEVAVSAQTDRPRMFFEENSGLANVQTMDTVKAAIRHHLEVARPKAAHRALRRRAPQADGIPPHAAHPRPGPLNRKSPRSDDRHV